MAGVRTAGFRRHITGISRDTDRFEGFGVCQQACLELGNKPLGDTGVRVDQDAGPLGVRDVGEH
ncbi:hypothetical protein HYG77_04955 [Rhodococcus sp. ZPP]|nr:hypothetical protein HYG77_04955 [Rhodococcus sp. ZPP]